MGKKIEKKGIKRVEHGRTQLTNIFFFNQQLGKKPFADRPAPCSAKASLTACGFSKRFVTETETTNPKEPAPGQSHDHFWRLHLQTFGSSQLVLGWLVVKAVDVKD